MSDAVSADLRAAVIIRARARCEYCGIPAHAVLIAHEVDHVIAEQHRGATTLENLALACFHCNRQKGPNIASIDPISGEIVRLFNPRTDLWNEHFRFDGAIVVGATAIGRATAILLEFNAPPRLETRRALLRSGLWRK